MEVKGLKCDSCDYKDMTVERKDYEKYINYPCPHCGHPILTIEDYKALCILEKIEKNWFFKLLAKIFHGKTTIEFHGNGFKNITMEEERKDGC